MGGNHFNVFLMSTAVIKAITVELVTMFKARELAKDAKNWAGKSFIRLSLGGNNHSWLLKSNLWKLTNIGSNAESNPIARRTTAIIVMTDEIKNEPANLLYCFLITKMKEITATVAKDK